MAPKGGYKSFFKTLYAESTEDRLTDGAAALGFYLMLSLFPAMILMLSVIPYLPIENVDQAIMDLLRQALPGEAAEMFTGAVQEVASQPRGGLLSVGILLTLWAASTGMLAVMDHLTTTYGVRDRRSFLKARSTAVALTIGVGVLIVASFSLIVLGGRIEEWMLTSLGLGQPVVWFFAALRWMIIVAAMLLAFAVTYYFGPDVEQRFRWISPGAVLGTIMLVIASLGFRIYVENFGDYAATYGSIGAVIVLMLWLYIAGLVILLGSEINAVLEDKKPAGKNEGERTIDKSRDSHAAA